MHTWNRRTARLPKTLALLLVSALGLSACAYVPFGFTPIKQIVDNPTQYENKQVKVQGVVSDVTKLPFVDSSFYTLTQDHSQIMVTARDTAPATGSHVVVIGVVESVAIVGDQSIGLPIREIKRVRGHFLNTFN